LTIGDPDKGEMREKICVIGPCIERPRLGRHSASLLWEAGAALRREEISKKGNAMPTNQHPKTVARGFTCVVAALALLSAVHATADAPRLAAAPQEMSPPSCANPIRYGALPNDDLDDRVAFQAAIDAAAGGQLAAREVCIPAGVWDLSRPPGPGIENSLSLSVAGVSNLVIRGVGPATRLRMLGDGYDKDWRLIDIRDGSHGIVVRDLTLDGTRRQNTQEQTHLLHLTGPVSGIIAERLVFDFPQLAGMSGGDCVRLLGDPGSAVRDVTLRHLLGKRCDRSFIGIQRGVYQVLIDSVESEVVGDQSIDFEPTGSMDLSDITIVNSRLARGANSQGGYTVVLGGNGAKTAKRVTLAHTTVADGGVHVIDTEGVRIEDVTIEGKEAAASTPVLHVRKRTVGLQIMATRVRRPPAMGTGTVLKIHQQSGAAPSDVLLDDVVLEQHTTAAIVEIESLGSFTLKRSTLVYGGTPGARVAVTGRGVIAALAHVELRDNTVVGPAQGLLRLGQYSPMYPIGQVIVTGTAAPDLTDYGVRFDNGLPSVPPIIEDNDFGSADPVQP
jgi:hypothetical protein